MPITRPAAVLTILAGMLGTFALDAALFRTRLYLDWLPYESTTGVFEARLRTEREYQRYPGRLVVTLGDSRFAYLPRVANHFTHESGYTFRHAGLAGTNARTWYYMLRELDPTARRYSAVVLGFDDFEDQDTLVDYADDQRSLHYIIGHLRLADLPTFASSHRTAPSQWAALRGGLLRGITLQSDVQDFLLHPRERLRLVELNRRGWAGWTYDYDDEERSLAGLEMNWATRQITYPPNMDPSYRKIFYEILFRGSGEDTGHKRAFHREWVGRIVDHYRGSPTQIIFVRLPRGPLSAPTDLPPDPRSSLRLLARNPQVHLGDPARYRSLERPDYFKDPLHLNRPGAHAFSKMLVDEVCQLIGPPR